MFSLADYIVDAPETGERQQERLEYIPFEQIIPDPNNGYSMDGIEDLARNISMVGLRDPLRVYPVDGGGYMISSGHRRHAAIGMVMESNPESFKIGIPCIIDRAEDSPAVREFKLLMANMDNRKMSDADLSQQLLRVQEVCRQLEDEGFKLKGRARDWVAEMAGVSRTKVGTLQAIRNNLEPELLASFDRGELNTAVANELQKLPADFQLRIVRVVGKGLTMGMVKYAREWYEKGKRWDPCLSCPDGRACRRGDVFLKHDLEYQSDACFGETCCLTCRKGLTKYMPCQRRCAKCEALRKEDRDAIKEAKAKKEAEKLAIIKAETTESAKRIRKALNAANISDVVKVTMNNWRYCGEFTAGEIRDMADGVFPEDFHPTENPLQISRLKEGLPGLCETLQCSADYILGRTEELHPTAAAPDGWRYPELGQLPNIGDKVIAGVKYSPDAEWTVELFDYTDLGWRQYGLAVPDDITIRWMPYSPPNKNVPNLGTKQEREDAIT